MSTGRFDKAESMINKYRGLNYIYTVHWDDDEPIENASFVLDAATVGNPMRFFNDLLDDPSKINVTAASEFVLTFCVTKYSRISVS